jgi:hypothetical protein
LYYIVSEKEYDTIHLTREGVAQKKAVEPEPPK